MSLQDVLFKRAAIHFQNELGDSRFQAQGLNNLIGSVTNEIAKKQEEFKARKVREEEFQRQLNLQEAKTNTTKIGKLRETAIKKGAIIPPNSSVKDIETIIAKEVQQDEALELRKTDISEERLDLQRKELAESIDRNKRLLAQKRLALNTPIDIDTANPTESDSFILKEFGMNADDAIEQGLAIRKEGGKISLLPAAERERLLSGSVRTFPQTVATAIDEFKSSKDILTDVMTTYKDLQLDLNTTEKGLVQQLFADTGVLSIPQRSNLLRQFRNPKVAALYSKLERAFQKYRVQTTGAQASDKELKTLRPLIARLVDNPEVFQETMVDLQRELDQAVTNRFSTQRNLGRDKNVIDNMENSYFGRVTPTINNRPIQPEVSQPQQQKQEGKFSYLWN